jgi:4-amino-4-deoxy-L-arabinose transferase-like glycosyltransferase
MSETLFLFLLVLSVYLFIRFYESSSCGNTILFGIAGALTAMTRPTALLFVAVGALCALFRRQYWQATVIVVCTVLLFTPWVVRNYLTYHTVILTTAAGGTDLWLGNNPEADGGALAAPEVANYLKAHGYIETSEKGIQEAKEFILYHPFQFTELLVWKATAYWSVARPYAFWFYLSGFPQKVVLVWSVIWSLILFVLGLSGAWLFWRSKRPLLRWLVVFAVLMPLSVIPIIVETRYRLPVYPFLALFAGYFSLRWYRLHKENPNDRSLLKVALSSAAIITAVAAFDILRNLPLILSRVGSLWGC